MLSRQLAGALEAEFSRVRALLESGHGRDARQAIDRLMRASRVGLRLVRPWRVVLVGSVNVGKSSLVNALAGYARSIVSPEAGTTRDLLETRIVLEGWEVDLIDTAGLRDESTSGAAEGATERAGIDRAVAACEAADLVLRVVEAGAPAEPHAATLQPGDLLVRSKADLAGGTAAVPGGEVWTSAVAGVGIADLVAMIVHRLVPEESDEPGLLSGAVPFTDRQVALIEALLRAMDGMSVGNTGGP
jgi:tRNA modification GTPase